MVKKTCRSANAVSPLATVWKRFVFVGHLFLLAGVLSACVSGVDRRVDVSPPVLSDSVRDAETARLNAWFEARFKEAVSRHPMMATFLGSRENQDKWNDVSPGARDREIAIQRAEIADMQAQFSFDRLNEQGRLSWRLAEHDLERAIRADKWRDHEYVFNQMFGVQSRIPAFLIVQHKVTDRASAEAYIARLEGIRGYLGQHVDNSRRAAANGIRPPRFVYDHVISDSTNVVTGYPFGDAAADGSDDSPLMADIRGKLQALTDTGVLDAAESVVLAEQAVRALVSHTGPAYHRLIAFMENDRLQATDDAGVWKLPDGRAYYADRLVHMTTTDMTAGTIHQTGLDEVARIHGEMRLIMKAVDFQGSLQDFFAFTRDDPQFFYPETASGRARYLAEAKDVIDTMNKALPRVFNTFPRARLEVRAVEPFREQSAGKAFYNSPAPDGSRPGIYYANLFRMRDMPIYQMEALAYHEGLPGHHMQLAISQELADIPKFRKYGGYTAYTEGWGLYAEFLPREMGFYTDPYSDFGRLAMELWRAARLVVDTGLHDRQWTRQQAIDYLLANTPNPPGDCIKAIERYIVMPGQATAYKIGMNKIIALREEARAVLGDRFDIRAFHDSVLKNGPVPLSVLEQIVTGWVNEQKAG